MRERGERQERQATLDWRALVRARFERLRVHPAHAADLIEEVAQHLEDQYAELRASGVSDADARARLARQVDELATALPRVPRRHRPLDGAWQDVRYGWRGLVRAPGFTIVAVLSLALGIGATTAVFGLLNTILLERLAVRQPDELVALFATPQAHAAHGTRSRDEVSPRYDAGPRPPVGYADYQMLRHVPGMPPLAVYRTGPTTISVDHAPDYDVWADFVSGSFFPLLGARPLLGRWITPDDEARAAPVAVISQSYWEQHLAADPAVIGRTIDAGDATLTVVGVMPRSYHGLYFGRAFSVAIPVTLIPRVWSGTSLEELPMLPLVARLPAGETADRTVAMIDAALANAGNPQQLRAESLSRGLKWANDVRGTYGRFVLVLFAGVLILLLTACANVASLLLTRALTRQRELAVRLSMGASPFRLGRQLVVESLELATLGTVLGVLAARWGTVLLAHNLPPAAASLVDLIPLRPSPTMLIATVVLLVGATLLFSLAPTLYAARTDIRTPLAGGAFRATSRGRWSIDQTFVATQLALALVLVCAASLLTVTLRNIRLFDGGYRTARMVFANLTAAGTAYESRGLTPLDDDVLAAVRRVPGVEGAALATTAPLFGTMRMMLPVAPPGRSTDDPVFADVDYVTPGYLAATGARVLRGRDFRAGDAAGAPRVAIITDAFRRKYFADRDPVGATLAFDTLAFHIVGVADDAHLPTHGKEQRDDVTGAPTEGFYIPLAQSDLLSQHGPRSLVLVARTTTDPRDVAAAIRTAVDGAVPGLRVERLATLERVLDDALPRERLSAALAALFGLCALTLAAIGVYGVVAHSVTSRRAEIGVRLALGAQPRDALWLVGRPMLVTAAVGLVVGLPLAYAAGRAIAAQVYGVDPTSPWVMGAASAVLLLAGIAAAVVPARRAGQIDPADVLRAD